MSEKIAFASAIKRSITGPRTELETMPGYWVVPKKFSVSANDAINQHSLMIQKSIDQKPLLALLRKKREDGIPQEEIMKSLTDEEMLTLVTSADPKSADVAGRQRLQLLHGIAEHNLGDDPDKACASVNSELIATILELPEVAKEVCEIIAVWNSPLAVKSSESSGTSSNGSSSEPSSPTESEKQS